MYGLVWGFETSIGYKKSKFQPSNPKGSEGFFMGVAVLQQVLARVS
jgi:hypothetical protein